MRRMGPILVVLALLFVLTLVSRAGDNEATAVINKAIKAHFPKGVDTKKLGVRTKSKGTLHIMGVDLDYTSESAVQKGQFKEAMELDLKVQKLAVVTVFDGAKAWIRRGNEDVKVTDEMLNEFKEVGFMTGMMQGMFLKDNTVKFSLIGDAKVKGKDAVGVTVSREGKKDIGVYFDKKTGLMAKVEIRKRDIMSGQEIQEERFIMEYQDLNGNMTAKKVEIQRDGKAYIEVEVLEVQTVEKLDESEFAQPK